MKAKKLFFVLAGFIFCCVCGYGQSAAPKSTVNKTKQSTGTSQSGKTSQRASTRPKLAIEYFAEYTLFEDEFSNSHRNDKSSYYSLEEAMQVCPKGWHLPSQEEWAGIFPYSHILEKGEAVPISINGVIKNYFSEYRGGSDNPAILYAIRFKRDPEMELDNKLLSAYRYEFVGDKEDPLSAGLKVTVRYLGPSFKGNMDDIANETYWKTNNKEDIVRIFPYAGSCSRVGYKPGGIGSGTQYWTSSTPNESVYWRYPRCVFLSGNSGNITVMGYDSNRIDSSSSREWQVGRCVRCILDKQ
jgi:hypothetical protein